MNNSKGKKRNMNHSSDKKNVERSIIAGVFRPEKSEHEIKLILEELELLTESAGGKVVSVFYQKRKSPDKKYHIGSGKVDQIKNFASSQEIDLIVFCNYLSNIQQRNLEKVFKIKVIDRTRLILDIFATRARSLEGKLQVELAQLFYLLPRLTGKGVELSRLGGGIGTRGPGETKLEVDRRTIKKRISMIKKRLFKVIKNREVQRRSRKMYPVPVVSLVGYTSAGKSTLFKALTDENVSISKKLFSTLDPILRRVELNEIKEGYFFMLSDTVGFIRDMPGELFKSFKATLEEMIQSDIILHIIDISNPDYMNQKNEVQKILCEIKIPEKKILVVYNKTDLLEANQQYDDYTDSLNKNNNNEIFVSAKEKKGTINLKKEIFNKYFNDYEKYNITVPQNIINLDSIRKWAIIVKKNNYKDLLNIEILCSREKMLKFKENYGGYIK